MNQIVIGFGTSANPFNPLAAAIRAVEGVPYSHCYLKFWSNSLERWLIYHAAHTKLQFVSSANFMRDERPIQEFYIPVTDAEQRAALQFCVDHVGDPYGALELIGMAGARIMKRVGLRPRNLLANGLKTEVCSEVVGHILIILGVAISASELEIEGPSFMNQKTQELAALRGIE
jgi:hypothetical protein